MFGEGAIEELFALLQLKIRTIATYVAGDAAHFYGPNVRKLSDAAFLCQSSILQTGLYENVG
jgi:hypothetical protein